MKPQTRADLEALYREHVRPRPDGEQPLSLEDHLGVAAEGRRLGLQPVSLAAALGVPVSYIRALERALAEGEEGRG